MANETTPFDLGYVMPAEWEEHEGTWLAWPKNELSFPGESLKDVEKTYLIMIEKLSKNERVHLLVDNEEAEKKVVGLLTSQNANMSNVSFYRIPTGDVWFRDYGPIFILRKDIRRIDVGYTHWMFNAWGNKYEDLKQDIGVPDKMPLRGFKGYKIPIVLEGGSIETNGVGTFITTEQCLLNKNRNPSLTKDQIVGYLRRYLGAVNVIWLKEGIAGDDTDGHIDDIARFVSRDIVVCAVEEDPKDENYQILKNNFDTLNHSQDQDGNELKVVRFPMPKKVEYQGQRLPASYINFYIGNKTVLVPTFNDENDAKAIMMLEKLFPGREVFGIDCRALVNGFGAIHCVTQQQPLGSG